MDTPKKLKPAHLYYLDELRESGATNMFGAGPHLKNAYPYLTKAEARSILAYWMQTFSERKGLK